MTFLDKFQVYIMCKYQLGLITATDYEGIMRSLSPGLSSHEPEKMAMMAIQDLYTALYEDRL